MSIHQSIEPVSAQLELANAYKARQARYAAMAVERQSALLEKVEIKRRQEQEEIERKEAERIERASAAMREMEIFFPFTPVKKIIHFVSREYGVSEEDIVSHRRQREPTFARQVAMYLAKKMTMRTLPEIARVFDRDHTTIMYGVGKIAALIATDDELRVRVYGIRSAIEGAT